MKSAKRSDDGEKSNRSSGRCRRLLVGQSEMKQPSSAAVWWKSGFRCEMEKGERSLRFVIFFFSFSPQLYSARLICIYTLELQEVKTGTHSSSAALSRSHCLRLTRTFSHRTTLHRITSNPAPPTSVDHATYLFTQTSARKLEIPFLDQTHNFISSPFLHSPIDISRFLSLRFHFSKHSLFNPPPIPLNFRSPRRFLPSSIIATPSTSQNSL